ncbi:hypothetical protein JOB18_036518 [Solea senegalensis]|uniref:Uncharacterized protein n=1 Tax=Solea senegalensis TaxID=28829 RepID=A0AAV6Q3V2_SOLSE|nr:hypothetical protein JOB18_036518 [Solea senegalensis]
MTYDTSVYLSVSLPVCPSVGYSRVQTRTRNRKAPSIPAGQSERPWVMSCSRLPFGADVAELQIFGGNRVNRDEHHCREQTCLPHHSVFTRKPQRQQHDDSYSIQREDARAPPGVSLLLLHPSSAQRSHSRQGSRRGGPKPVQHPRHGGDRAEQTDERSGIRSYPEAAHV